MIDTVPLMEQSVKIDWNDCHYFTKIAELGSFAAASQKLGVPTSTLSRRINALEQALDVRLLQRSTRSLHLTDAGRVFLEHTRAMTIQMELATEAISMRQSTPRGTIKLSCPVMLLHAYVSDMLAEFQRIYPDVQIQLEGTNRAVDVVNESFDLAIRVRPAPLADTDLVAKVLSDRGQCLVASPALLLQYAAITQPEDLAVLPSLSVGQSNGLYEWQLFYGDQSATIAHQPKLITTDMFSLRRAAIAGIGCVQLPRIFVDQAVSTGELIELLPNWQSKREIIHAVFASRRGMLPAVRLLIDHLAQAFSSINEQ